MDHFILSGQPHPEGAYWFGEGALPLLVEDGLIGDVTPGPAPARRPAPHSILVSPS